MYWTVEEVTLDKITLAENKNSHKCPFRMPYIVSMIIVFIISTGSSACFFITIGIWLKMFRLITLLKQQFTNINGRS